MTKTKDPICRSFRQDFPQFVARAEALGVNDFIRAALGSVALFAMLYGLLLIGHGFGLQ